MRNGGLISALSQLIVLSVIIIAALGIVISKKALIGPTVILLSFLPWIPLRITGRTVTSVGADIVFGAIDTGGLAIAALMGAGFAGVLGAVVGGAVGDSIADGFAGLFEGRVAEHLRNHGIDEGRTPLSTSMGKMSGCLLGAGVVLTIAWSILHL